MEPSIVFYEVLVLFIVMATGFVASKLGIIGEGTRKSLSSFIINITLPAVILMSSQIEFTQEKITNSLWLLGMSFIVFTVSILLAMFLFKKADSDKRTVLKFSVVFSNSAYMGFPVLDALMGAEGVFYGAVFLIPFNVFLWTYGVVIFKRHNSIRQMLKDIFSPSIIAMLAAFVLIGFKITIPHPLDRGLNLVGGLTTPLSMVVIGATLASAKFTDIVTDKWIYIASAARLLILPAVAYMMFFLLSPPEMSLRILVLLTGMPCAAATTIFAQQYGGNTRLASGIVSFSTLFSILTIPLRIFLFM
jgi:hypothetical protein